jgi:hypothetical protein
MSEQISKPAFLSPAADHAPDEAKRSRDVTPVVSNIVAGCM